MEIRWCEEFQASFIFIHNLLRLPTNLQFFEKEIMLVSVPIQLPVDYMFYVAIS